MLGETIEYINQNALFSEHDHLLLAVSGGIDSMVMLDIFTKLPYSFSVAHCNFLLRGSESDGDQELVESYCTGRGIEIYTRRFNTREYADKNGISIQMAARNLRYNWFEELRAMNNLDSIVLAHNKDDIIETFMINLSRGTGLKGLTGIKPLNNFIARPLLYASRNDIVRYSKKFGIKYREDSSNIDTKYKRNSVRHRIIPLFKELNPSFSDSMELTIKKLSETERLVSDYIGLIRERVFTRDKDIHAARIKELLNISPIDIVLYELFKDYGIGQSNFDELKKLLGSPSGKKIYTATHIIYKDRDSLIITGINEKGGKEQYFDRPEDITGFMTEVVPADKVHIEGESNKGYFDLEKIIFPITVRGWRDGDWFYPFGMKGRKKISDFFIDQKIPVNQKDRIKLFISDNNIFWVSGYRIDKRFAVTKTTRKVLVIYEAG